MLLKYDRQVQILMEVRSRSTMTVLVEDATAVTSHFFRQEARSLGLTLKM
jgi:hypothetical protein